MSAPPVPGTPGPPTPLRPTPAESVPVERVPVESVPVEPVPVERVPARRGRTWVGAVLAVLAAGLVVAGVDGRFAPWVADPAGPPSTTVPAGQAGQAPAGQPGQATAGQAGQAPAGQAGSAPAVGVPAGPPGGAFADDPAHGQFAFLLTLRRDRVDYGSPAQAIAIGHLACAALAGGDHFAAIVQATRGYGGADGTHPDGYSAADATALVSAAIPAFCPRFAGQLPPG